MPKVTFLSANGFCELQTESSDNCWIARFTLESDKPKIEYLRNLRSIPSLPVTPLTNLLADAVNSLGTKIIEYMRAKPGAYKESMESKMLWWEIKNTTEAI
jgi:hypothetical protein